MDEGDGEQGSPEEARETRQDHQEAAHRTERGVIRLPERCKPLLSADGDRHE